MAKVLLKFKEAVLKEIPLNQDVITIGRKADNDIVIDNQAVSGYHARIKKEGRSFFIEDANSLNGTYLNGQKISKGELHNGDVVLIGVHTLDVIWKRQERNQGFCRGAFDGRNRRNCRGRSEKNTGLSG